VTIRLKYILTDSKLKVQHCDVRQERKPVLFT